MHREGIAPAIRTRHNVILVAATLGSFGLLRSTATAGQFTITELRDTLIDSRGLVFAQGATYGRAVNGNSFETETIATYNGYQYTAYWAFVGGGTPRQLALARRPVASSTWEVTTLSSVLQTNDANDAHNVVSMGLSPLDGTIHLAYDMHDDNLRYRRSSLSVLDNPASITWNSSLFSSAETSVLYPSGVGGGTVTSVSYPMFITTPTGNMQMSFRRGVSGNGSFWLYDYNAASHTWSNGWQIDDGNVGTYTGTQTNAGPNRNNYPNGITYGPDGELHMTFTWRESATGVANHDLNYVYSDNGGQSWKNNAGTVVADRDPDTPAIPDRFTINSPGLVVRSLPENQTLMNQQHQAVDSTGKVHALTWHRDPAKTAAPTTPWQPGESSYYHYWRDDLGNWHQSKIPSAVGQRPKIFFDTNDNAIAVYQANGAFTSGVYITSGDLVIAAASKESNWTDWKVLLTKDGGYVSEAQADRDMLKLHGVLSVVMQESPTTTGQEAKPIHAIDYSINLSPSVVSNFTSASGDWDSAENWSGASVPAGNSTAIVDNSRTAIIDQLAAQVDGRVVIGTADGAGTLNVVSGASFNVDGSLIVGRDGGGVGTYVQSGGVVNARRFVVGDYFTETSGGGPSSATVSGGTLNVSFGAGSMASGELQIAVSANGSSEGSSFMQTGGAVTVGGDIVIAEHGSVGSLALTGGTLTIAGEIRKGFNKTNTATLRMDGGTLAFTGHRSANNITVDHFIYNGGVISNVGTTSLRNLAGINTATMSIGSQAHLSLPTAVRVIASKELHIAPFGTLTMGPSTAVRVGTSDDLLDGDFTTMAVNITSGGVLSGSGNLNAAVNNISGKVAPGPLSPRELTIYNTYTQGAAGTLDIELGGLFTYDRLRVTNAVTLDGTLRISTTSGFIPLPGQTFDVMSYGPRTGMMSLINATGFNGLVFTQNYGTHWLNIVASALYDGDANLDGQVDVADLGILASNWQGAANWLGGDFDGNGGVDVNDLGLLATHWQAGVPASSGEMLDELIEGYGLPPRMVPEPGLLSILSLFPLFNFRRIRCPL
jgi:hypothetical protein